jgi:hypothetical protein
LRGFSSRCQRPRRRAVVIGSATPYRVPFYRRENHQRHGEISTETTPTKAQRGCIQNALQTSARKRQLAMPRLRFIERLAGASPHQTKPTRPRRARQSDYSLRKLSLPAAPIADHGQAATATHWTGCSESELGAIPNWPRHPPNKGRDRWFKSIRPTIYFQ